MTMEICEEMQQLRKMLTEKGIEWEDNSEIEHEHIWMVRTQFNYNNNHYSVINGFGSYGGINFIDDQNTGLLELWSAAVNDGEPYGYLTANECIKLIMGEDLLSDCSFELRLLIETIKAIPGEYARNYRAMIIQSYIQRCGPIPDKYGDMVKRLIAGEVKGEENGETNKG